ncbi:spore coat polysaccharide biosynthesis protein SpsF [Paenibacillus cellulosilyticus]|uniref:Spore coat polysaccharide biosynthesis protein SpsF n=1 Tax=Paenibacillus cellulosilyticus TaxID=375489 RepID=A0A2V2YZP2_9BACL|nr:glycosyltransferase family protein [Paenibacillus cellulosilyticus]PWW08345.1 spore coat polysaccharide biosynthesis protein SpsF [Paenibacillus cellulosilyticus]QKS47943.1 glycosyltransferase family protein [Paenibacillus cellulosilyticus]
MSVFIIVQARMTSTRLPGKVLLEVLDKPLLEYQIERLKRVTLADGIIIATTDNDTDDPIVELCKRLGVRYSRGSEDDVLSRYYYAAKQYGANTIVRVTSDCPVIDPDVIDRAIRLFKEGNYDFVANGLGIRTYPRGMDTEVFTFKALEEAFLEAKEAFEREHVTPFIVYRGTRYTLFNEAYSKDCSRHRWTVDTSEDFELIKRIIEHLYKEKNDFTLEDALELLDRHPEWELLNAHIEQKKLGE